MEHLLESEFILSVHGKMVSVSKDVKSAEKVQPIAQNIKKSDAIFRKKYQTVCLPIS
jgi:hypothetical protein